MELLNKVSNYTLLPTLYKATSNDEAPVQLHILEDIRRMTFESGQSLEFIQKFLLDKVKSSGAYSRAKCLRIFKHLIDNGPLDFTVQLRRSAQPIESCKSFTGPLDPLHGDAPYVAVRQAAIQVLDLLYDDNRDVHRRMNTMPASGKMAGIAGPQGGGGGGGGYGGDGYGGESGPSSSSGPSGMSSYGGNKMWGFGNTPYRPEETSFLDKLKDKASAVVDSVQSQLALQGGGGQKRFDSSYVHSNQGTHLSREQTMSLANSYSSASYTQTSDYNEPSIKRTIGRPGGGWDAPEYTPKQSLHPDTLSESSEAPVSRAIPEETVAVNQHAETSTSSEGSAELRLVEELTAVAGVRATPSREQVQQFITRCKRLNISQIVQHLSAVLSSSSSQVQVRALCLVEALIHNDVRNAAEQIQEQLPSRLHELCQRSQGAVLSKATKLLRQIAPDSEATASAASTDASVTSTTSPTAASSNLLDIVPTSSSSLPEGGDMFSNMNIGGSLAQVSPQPAVQTVPAAQSVPATQALSTGQAQMMTDGGASLFGGMEIKPMASVPAPTSSQPVSALLPASQPTPTASSQSAELSSMFGGLNLSSSSQSAAIVPDSGDALMLNTEVDPFDPLKGAGGGVKPTVSPSLTTSPNLMQASTATSVPAFRPMMPMQGMMQGGAPMMQMTPSMTSPMMSQTTSPLASQMTSPGVVQPGMRPVGQQVYTAPVRPVYAGPSMRTEVQLASAGSNGPSDTNFGFLGQGSKGGAFDFVQDAMKAHKK